MERIRDTERSFLEGTLTQAEANAITVTTIAASPAAPYAPGILSLLAALDYLPVQMQDALPQLIVDANLVRITDALRAIDNELNNYFADSDTGHLANAVGTMGERGPGLAALHQATRRSFGYWQMGQDPGRQPPIVADLDLRPERRQEFAGKLLAALQSWVPGSRAEIRGSPGSGRADDYSDIDIRWVVPEISFAEAADTAGAALSQVSAVLTLRTDPGLARPAGRRQVFARLYGVPLFWRLDIDIRADSVATDDQYDARHPDARSDEGWSAPASAIEDAIAAIKAARRGQADTASRLLRRGGERIGDDTGPHADLADAITSLADACASQEPQLARLAAEISLVADRLLRSNRPS
jgi:hypothetical protein